MIATVLLLSLAAVGLVEALGFLPVGRAPRTRPVTAGLTWLLLGVALSLLLSMNRASGVSAAGLVDVLVTGAATGAAGALWWRIGRALETVARSPDRAARLPTAEPPLVESGTAEPPPI